MCPLQADTKTHKLKKYGTIGQLETGSFHTVKHDRKNIKYTIYEQVRVHTLFLAIGCVSGQKRAEMKQRFNDMKLNTIKVLMKFKTVRYGIEKAGANRNNNIMRVLLW